MEQLTVIKPYTIILVVGEMGSGLVYHNQYQIEKLLDEHKIQFETLNSYADTHEIFELEKAFSNSPKVIIVSLYPETDLNDIQNLAIEHHWEIMKLDAKSIFQFVYGTTPPNLFQFDGTKYCVVGDVHGSFHEFKKMLSDNKGIGFDKKTGKIVIMDETKYMKHILVGDYIDKGDYKGIRAMINFLYENLEHFIIVVGNHEYWVAEYLLGHQKPSSNNTKLIGEWFQSVVLLLQDAELREKFFYIYNRSYNSVETDLAIITHSPCLNKYLRKEDNASLRAQRNLQYPKTSIDAVGTEPVVDELTIREQFFQFLKDEANDTDKYHIFGHTMIDEIFKFKNKICLDTGCVVGGKLSVAIFNEGELEFKSYKSLETKHVTKLYPYFRPDVTETIGVCSVCGSATPIAFKCAVCNEKFEQINPKQYNDEKE